MNPVLLQLLLRHGLTFLGGLPATHGVTVTAAETEAVAGAVEVALGAAATIGGVVMSAKEKRKRKH